MKQWPPSIAFISCRLEGQRERGEEKFATVGSSLVGCANRAFSFYNRQVKIAGCLPGFLAFYVLFLSATRKSRSILR